MIETFLKSYGSIITIILVAVGWYVIFDSSKYLTSRNEAKSLINELTKLLESSFSDSVNYWSHIDYSIDSQKTTITAKNALIVKQIKAYRSLLENYDIMIISENDFIEMKKVLTLTPEKSIIDDSIEYEKFCNTKVKNSQYINSKLIYEIHNYFISKYKPVKKPILHYINFQFLQSPLFQAIIFSSVLMILYFSIGNFILN